MANQDTCQTNILLSAAASSTMDALDFDYPDDEPMSATKKPACKTKTSKSVGKSVEVKNKTRPKQKQKAKASASTKSSRKKILKPPAKKKHDKKKDDKKKDDKKASSSMEQEQEKMAHQLFHDLEVLADEVQEELRSVHRRSGQVSNNLLSKLLCVCVGRGGVFFS